MKINTKYVYCLHFETNKQTKIKRRCLPYLDKVISGSIHIQPHSHTTNVGKNVLNGDNLYNKKRIKQELMVSKTKHSKWTRQKWTNVIINEEEILKIIIFSSILPFWSGKWPVTTLKSAKNQKFLNFFFLRRYEIRRAL